MKRLPVNPLGVLIVLAGMTPLLAEQTRELAFPQVVERIMVQYPTLKVAQYQIARARQEINKVQSQLGWTLAGNGGISHDVSVFGTPTDRADVNLSLERKLESGHSVGISGNYTYEDSSFTISSAFPNPSHATELDLNYRIPLAQGEDNSSYYQGLVGAEAGIAIEQATAGALRNDIANQAMELYYAKALTEARLTNAREALKNAQRLQSYIKRRSELGLAEKKDRLQARAQVRSQQTTLKQLEVALEQQQIALNRLMGEPWQAVYSSQLQTDSQLAGYGLERLFEEARQSYPPLEQNRARLELTESVLQRSRDQRKDKLDLVMSVGTRTRAGDSASGSVSEEDVAGQIRFEYREAVDKQGLDAEVRQAQLDRTIAIENIRLARDELNYSLASLLREIDTAQQALESAKQHLQSEREKYAEAMQRYREGRAETDRLIQYENELNAARLNVAQQRIELARRIDTLKILHGSFWNNLAQRTAAP